MSHQVCLFWTFPINGIIHFGLWYWLISASMFSRFIHVASWVKVSFIFMAKCSILWIYTFSLSVHQLMDICSVSTFWTIINNAALHIHVQIFVWTFAFSSLCYISRSGTAELCSSCMFNILRNCWNVYQRGCTFNNLSNNVGECQFLCILAKIC